MIHFKLSSTTVLKKHDVVALYEKSQQNPYAMRTDRTFDLIFSTTILLVLGLILFAILKWIIQKTILCAIDGTILAGIDYIVYLNLCGGVLIGLKILRDSIIYTYLTHSIAIKLEKGKGLEYIYQYLQNEWGIHLNV